ncbi:magnesium transporter [Xaviernesmea oryzae]|uniref:Magnesium transport protein CorA n=1 Tax=Xaviernesmea oryzae TaxID=464029 RepID=A0A1Q9ATI1_9HYPH|nr:magnesium transporter CorA family protein [Xaviernesmea oryzae]OLP58732.1 magnesium transporter [Xaviernesmea oryzae]SEK70492.1 magnesium transporter [Xaviernesmea oryzae]
MIALYDAQGESLTLDAAHPPEALPEDIVWIDMLRPTREEDALVERLLGIEVPTREDLKDIEPSSRLYTTDQAVFMTASLVCRADGDHPVLTDVAFVLAGKRLVTVRYDEPKAFALFRAAMPRIRGGCTTGVILAVRLFETIVDRTAEILEQAVEKLDGLSFKVFDRQKGPKRRPPHYLEARLLDVALHHRLIAKARDSLASLARVVTFLQSVPVVEADAETKALVLVVSRDIQSLSEHAGFIFGNITFLLDASLGLISVEQNAIIKIFSIASVVFLPPTLVASIYGMNFEVMPELHWHFGYPLALLAMLVSAIVPFFVFRWKGWL